MFAQNLFHETNKTALESRNFLCCVKQIARNYMFNFLTIKFPIIFKVTFSNSVFTIMFLFRAHKTEQVSELVKAIFACLKALTSKKLCRQNAISQPSRLTCVAMLARISLRDIVLARNKYLIVTSDAFLLQNNAFKRIVSVLRYVLPLLWKKILWVTQYPKVAKFSIDNN